MSLPALNGAAAPPPVASRAVRVSRMDLLARRDASRWGGMGELEAAAATRAAAAAEARAQSRIDPALLAGAPLELGGNEASAAMLHAQLLKLQRAADLSDAPAADAAATPAAATAAAAANGQSEARKLLAQVHSFLRGRVGIVDPKPPVHREGDPPPLPPPAPLLSIDPALMAVTAARELAPELLVATAETAAKLCEWETVWSCLSLYSSSAPSLSQYRVRALLVQARAQAAQSRGLKGEAFLAHVLAGLALVDSALQLLLSHAAAVLPAYNFLLYNAAATYMHIGRPLMREGQRRHLVRGLTALALALEEHIPAPAPGAPASTGAPGGAGDPVVEKNAAFEIELLRALVLCTEEAGDADASARFMSRAWNLLTKHYTAAPLDTRTATLRLAVHVLRHNPRALETFESDLHSLSLARRRGAFVPGFRALILLQKLRSGALGERDPAMVEETLKRCVALLTDPATEAAYEDSDDNAAAAPPQKGRREGRKSPAPTAAAGAIASSAGSQSLSSKKKRLAPAGSSAESLVGSTLPSPRDAAAAEVARLAAVEAARQRDRQRKKARSESENERLCVLAQVGWEAFAWRLYPLAQSCCNRAIVSKRAGLWPAWVLAELVAVLLDVRRDESEMINIDGNDPHADANSGLHGYAEFRGPHAQSSSGSPSLSSGSSHQTYATRIHGLKILDQTLSSALRLRTSAPELVEQLVGEMWNLCLPLLQRNLVGSIPIVPKVLKACAAALGPASGGGVNSVSTPLIEVRVLLHYEIALFEAANDFVSKALAQMECALQLDYSYPYAKLGAAHSEAVRNALADPSAATQLLPSAAVVAMHAEREAPFLHLLRPYDSEHLRPLMHRLRVAAIMYDEPAWFRDCVEDQAARWIEQAREVKVASLSQGALMRQNAHLAARGHSGPGRTRNHMKRNLLLKAMQLLDAPIFQALNSSGGVAAHVPGTVLTHTSPEQLARWDTLTRQKRAHLWSEVVRMAFEQGFLDLMHVGVAHLDEIIAAGPGAAAPAVNAAGESAAAAATGEWNQERHAVILQQHYDALALQVRACAHWVREFGSPEGPGLILSPGRRTAEEAEALAAAAAASAGASAENEGADGASPPTTASKKKGDKTRKSKGAPADNKDAAGDSDADDGAGSKTTRKDKDSKEPSGGATGAPAGISVPAPEDGVEPHSEELDRRLGALFYESLLNRSLVGMLRVGSRALTAERWGHLLVNTGVLMHNVYQRLFYKLLREPTDSYAVWVPPPTALAPEAERNDVRSTLVRVWDALVAQAKQPGARVRKPALMLQLATVLARVCESEARAGVAGAEAAALAYIQTALTLVSPGSFAHAHPAHPAYSDPLAKKALYEIWTRVLLRRQGTAAFASALASLAQHPHNQSEAQLCMILELLRSTAGSTGGSAVSIEEKRRWIQEGVTILVDCSAALQAKLAVPLAVFNGELPPADDQPQSPATRGGRKAGENKSRERTSRSAEPKKRRSRANGAPAAEEESTAVIPDPLHHTRRMNAQTYARLCLQWRELDTLLWSQMAEEAHALREPILGVQLCYVGLQSLPEWRAPRLDLPQGIINTLIGRPASPSGKGRGGKGREQRKQKEESKEADVSASPRSARKSPASSPRLAADGERGGDRSLSPGLSGTAAEDALLSPAAPASGLGAMWSYEGTEARSNVTASRLRNYSMLALLYGKNIVALVDPARHSQPAQDQIRRQSLGFLEKAAGLAAAALQKHLSDVALVASAPHLTLQHCLPTFEVSSASELIMAAAKCFWNTALPMTYEPMTRRLLVPFLAPILEHLETVVEVLASMPPTTNGTAPAAKVPGSNAVQSLGAAAAVQQLDPAFRCDLYLLYLSALKDTGAFEAGYACSSRALKSLPAAQRKQIWTSRIVFMSRLGLDVGVAILKMKDQSRGSQAHVWLALARGVDARTNPAQKFDFFLKAIDVLEEESTGAHSAARAAASSAASAAAADSTMENVEVLIEFAEFLYSAHFPLRDAQEQLYAALDLLARREHSPSADELSAQLGGTMERGSVAPSRHGKSVVGSAHGSGSVVGSGPPSSRLHGHSGSVSGFTATPSRAPSAFRSTAGSTIGEGSRVGGHRRRSSGGGSGSQIGLDQRPGDGQGLGVRHLLTLVRIYSMLAGMAPTSREQSELALVAHHYVLRVWEEVMKAVDQGFYGRLPVNAAAAAASAAGSSHQGGNGSVVGSMSLSRLPSFASGASSTVSKRATLLSPKAGSAAAHAAAALAAPAFTGSPAAASTPYVCLPSSPEEWLSFALPLAVRTWIADQVAAASAWSDSFLHKGTISPTDGVMLLHYLSAETLPALERGGLVLHTLPVFYLMDLLVSTEVGTQSLLRHRGYSSLLWLKLARVYDALHQPALQSAALARAEPILPVGEEAALLRNLVEKREQLQMVQRQQEEDAALSGSDTGVTKRTALQLVGGGSPSSCGEARSVSPGSPSRPGTALTSATGFSAPGANMYGEDVLLTSESILREMASYAPAELPALGPDLNVRAIWAEMAELLLARGKFPLVKQLVHEWLYRFCQAWSEDVDSSARMFRAMALVARYEGALTQALSLERHAQASHFGRATEWTQGIERTLAILSAQIYRSSTALPVKQALQQKQRAMLKHAMRTFQHLLTSPSYRASNRSNARELKECIARLWIAQATLAEEALAAGFDGFGSQRQQNPAVLPVSFQGADNQSEMGGAADRVGVARIDTAASSASRPGTGGSVVGAATLVSLAPGHSASSAVAAFVERKALQPEQQRSFGEVWSALEQAAFIYGDSSVVEGVAPLPDAEVDECITPLQDAPAHAAVLLRHAHSLMRYADLFAIPAAEVKSASDTANNVLLQSLLQKVTQGTQALHQSLLLLSKAESLLTSQLLLVKPASLGPSVSLPLQRELHRVHLAMSCIYLQLFKYKRPKRRYVDEAAEAARARQKHQSRTQVLQLDAESPSMLTFADDIADKDGGAIAGSSRLGSMDALSEHQQRMNDIFFDRYESVFLDEETEARRILQAGAEAEMNEQALHLAASAANLEGSFIGVLRSLAAATRAGGSSAGTAAVATAAGDDKAASSALSAVAAPGTGSSASFHPRALLDEPAPFLALGQSMAALALEAREQAEWEATKAEEVAAQARKQVEWAEKVAAEAAAAAAASQDPRQAAAAAARRSREEAEAAARREADERAAEAERELTARAQLLAENEARIKAEAEAQAAASASKGSKSKKKKGVPALSAASLNHPMPDLSNVSSGEKHFNPPLEVGTQSPLTPGSGRGTGKKLSARDAKAAAAAQAEQVRQAAEAALAARPPFDSYAHDKSWWSPALLQVFIVEQDAVRARADVARREEEAINAAGGKKKPAAGAASAPGAASKKATPTPMSPNGSKRRSASGIADDAATIGDDKADQSVPPRTPFPLATSMEGQAISALQRAIDLCVRDETDMSKVSTLAAASLELANLTGTRFPVHTAKYIHLHMAATLKLQALHLLQYTSPATGAEALVMARMELLQAESDIAGPELERSRQFLRAYSEPWRTVSSYAAGFFQPEAPVEGADGTVDPQVNDAVATPSVPASPQSHGHQSFLNALAALPDGMVTLALQYDAPSQCIYAVLQSRDVSSTLVARAALSRDAIKEFALLLTQNNVLQHKIQRSVMVYGSLSNAVPLDSLERSYATYLSRLDAFLAREVLAPLHAFDGLFRSKDVVLLLSDPTLFALPLEALAMFSGARSVARDFGLYVLAGRVAAANAAPIQGVNVNSVAYVVDALAQDGSVLSNPAFVGPSGAALVHQAMHVAAANAAQQQQSASSALMSARPVSASPLKKGGRKAAAPSGATGGSEVAPPTDADPLSQPDMVRVLHEVRSMLEAPGCLAANNSSAASAKGDKADKESSAALAALKAASQGWTGLHGGAHIPVAGEWAALLSGGATHCGAFIYLGYESFLARLAPHEYSCLPQLQGASAGFAGMQALLLFDRSVNDVSYRTQSKLENGKSGLDRLAESPFHTALLATLKGVPSVLLRAHCSSGSANAALAKRLLEHTLWEGASLGQAVRAQHMAALAAAQTGLAHQLEDPALLETSAPSAGESVDMLKYLDHALWAAEGNAGGARSRATSPGKRGAPRAQSSARPRGSRPVGPTSARLRDSSPMSPQRRLESKSPTRRLGASSSSVSLNSGVAAAQPKQPAAPALKLRVYDRWNVMCVGLPYLRMQ